MTARLVALADRAREHANVARLEVHADLPGEDVHRRPRGVAHVLSLSPDPKLTFERFSRSQVQRNVRKAQRVGLTLRRAETAEDLTESFYRLLWVRGGGSECRFSRVASSISCGVWSLRPVTGFVLLAYRDAPDRGSGIPDFR